MNWKWEELTGPDFVRAVANTRGVCLVPFGVLEKHGDHLPLGTDMLTVRAVAEKAVALESAVLFPFYFFGQINEGQPFPGTFALPVGVVLELLERTCDEIARNGFHKIILLNGHGGNESALSAFAMTMLEKPRDYTLYIFRLADYWAPVNQDPAWLRQQQTPFDHHGGEVETSVQLAVRPDLVQMEAIAEPGNPLPRLNHLPPMLVPISWYAAHPAHYAGDARPATRAKGEFLLPRYAAKVAQLIKAVKDDTAAPALQAEHFSRCRHGR